MKNTLLSVAAIAALMIVGSPEVRADIPPNEFTLKSITDKAAFERLFFETVKNNTSVSTECYPADQLGPAYCGTNYRLDKGLIAILEVDSDGTTTKKLWAYEPDGSLFLHENGRLSSVVGSDIPRTVRAHY